MLFAVFGLPKVMSVMPDFDPLTMIVAVFGVLALMQHLGFAASNAEADSSTGASSRANDEGDAPSASRGASARGSSSREKKAREASPQDLMEDAEKCMKQNSYSKVQELAKKALDLDPENGRAWELLATSQKWDGKRDEAMATVKKAAELYEVSTKGLKALAKELQGSHDPAKVVAENAEKGEAFIAKRQYDLASECFSKAIDALGGHDGNGSTDSSTASSRLRVFRCRAECAQQLQDWSLCRRDATVVLELEPSDAQALLQRAASNEALEKFKAALDDARKLLSLDPRNKAANRIAHNCQQALRD